VGGGGGLGRGGALVGRGRCGAGAGARILGHLSLSIGRTGRDTDRGVDGVKGGWDEWECSIGNPT